MLGPPPLLRPASTPTPPTNTNTNSVSRPSTCGATSASGASSIQRVSTSSDSSASSRPATATSDHTRDTHTPTSGTRTESTNGSRPTSASSTTSNGGGSGGGGGGGTATGVAPVTIAPASSSALSSALAAAAASTSASLFNITELFDTVKLMACGRVFTGYFANSSLMEPIKQDLFVFYDCCPNRRTNGTAPAPTGPQMNLGGALYWSVVSRDGSVHRTRAADLSLALSEIDDIYLGKRTNAFTLPFAASAREDCCFSLIAKNRTHMNFEAKNPVSLVSWLFGLKRLVQANKKLLEPITPTPNAGLTNGTLDIHDTNQTSLKNDIWQAILQGIAAGTALFAQNIAAQTPNNAHKTQQQQQQQQHTQQHPHQQQQHPPQPHSQPPSASAQPSSGGSSGAANSNSNSNSGQSHAGGGFFSNLLGKGNKENSRTPQPQHPPQPQQQQQQQSLQSKQSSSRDGSRVSRGGLNSPSASVTFLNPFDDGLDPLQIFQILGRVGQGNYGYVYKARDTRDDSLVAIKILEVDSAASSRELEAEISILAKCHSPYIVSYRGTFLRGAQIWIIMEYCLAGSVCDLMAITDRILNESQIAAILAMCLQGLAYFHALNHLHRDIKAGNILINEHGIVKLSDFGVSAQLTASISKRKTVLGSPYWMAPEVLTSTSHSTSYNDRADIWSLGATAIELATGDPPFHDLHPMKAIFAIPNLPAPRLPVLDGDGQPCTWSQPFQDFVTICMSKDPNARPSALQLQGHPFVRSALATAPAIIKQLVLDSMPDIDKYREIEARMANKVAFGSRNRRGGDGDSESEYSVSRSRSSLSRSIEYSYGPSYGPSSQYNHGNTNANLRSVKSFSDMRSGGGGSQNSFRVNPVTSRWEKELSRSERDRDRIRREREWELELSRRDADYSQRSHSPSFSTSSMGGGTYWSSAERDREREREDTPVRREHSLTQQSRMNSRLTRNGSNGVTGVGDRDHHDRFDEDGSGASPQSRSRSHQDQRDGFRSHAYNHYSNHHDHSFDGGDDDDRDGDENTARERQMLSTVSPSLSRPLPSQPHALLRHSLPIRADPSASSSDSLPPPETTPISTLPRTRPASASTPPLDHLTLHDNHHDATPIQSAIGSNPTRTSSAPDHAVTRVLVGTGRMFPPASLRIHSDSPTFDHADMVEIHCDDSVSASASASPPAIRSAEDSLDSDDFQRALDSQPDRAPQYHDAANSDSPPVTVRVTTPRAAGATESAAAEALFKKTQRR